MNGNGSEKRYQELAKKWLNKTIAPAEQEEFAAWYSAGQDKPLNIPDDFAEDEETHKARILAKINEAIKYDRRRGNKIKYLRWASIAAACLLLLSIPPVYFHLRKKIAKPSAISYQKKPLQNDVNPGGNKATVTLGDGSKIVLNDARKGVLTSQGKTLLNKAKSDQLVYVAPASVTSSLPVVYNTISTPRGGQFQVVLSDGTKVWLNAASSITFPTIFTKGERRVNITGEVYFEVAKNKELPFRVVAGKQTVEVLGTHFNINSYADENSIKTTLAEGSVKVSTEGQTVILKPDQQANVSNSGKSGITINNVDTDDILAWKEGSFVFEKADIPFIMRQASRWYDVTIKYEGNISERRFTGSISRSVNLSELLKMLKYTGVNFRISDKTIVVGS
ncbi:MAG TPA: FecR domain-containing protein [Mucilaginibacter sp.]|nr:FecR domain-containing protein [Mucilaginibacter sp.]